MKKLLLLVAATASLVSCDDSEPMENSSFFQLNEGNMWVYKRYASDSQGENAHYTGQNDTVRTAGQVVIEGITYFKFTHTLGDDEFVRIDGRHLVNNEGFVLHSGWDKEYTYSRNIDELGTVNYHWQNWYSGEVEGKPYVIYPYEGYFTPTGSNIPAGIADLKAYMPGIGFLIKRSRYVSSAAYTEDRLVYYKLI